LSKVISKKHNLDKFCTLSFDEVSLSADLTYCGASDLIIGYEDLGLLGRTKDMAKNALVFMVQGLRKSWKQPVAYYFVKNSVKAIYLKQIICKVISELQSRGFKVVATVCDQGSTNVSAIHKLQKTTRVDERQGPYFFVNNNKVITFFDTPHLLKNTRNALARYNIRFANNNVAKFQHIIDAYQTDKTKRFRMLYKIHKCFLNIKNPSNRALKMKVSVAAKTMSATVASAIETAIAVSPNMIPNNAIHTAEFVNDINKLFDSMNGNLRTKSKGNSL
jgi:hypothetical protein